MKKILVSIFAFSLVLGLVIHTNPVNADGGVSIYDCSYGEILKITDKESYDELSVEQKNYFESIPASTVLGQTDSKETKDELIYDNTGHDPNSREASLIIGLTQAKLARKNNNTLTYGGIYSSTYPIQIKGYAYLIRNKDGRIMKSATCSADSSVSKTLTKDAKITKGNNKYYCRAVGIYTSKTLGSKTTSQSTVCYK